MFRLDVTPEQAQALADELSRAAEASLFHPSIVEPIAAGIQGTVAYRAEEYVAAESLDVAMRHYAPAALDKALPFITQLAGAIDFARASGVGHGALHPRDVFVTPDEARATGFGVVEALERVGQRAPVRRPYSPPERIAGASWTTSADVFSLAAIAFELLTGRRPAGTGTEIGPLSRTDLGKVVGPALHAVLARAMEDRPDYRYGGALEFAAALEAASRGEHPTGAATRVAAVATIMREDPTPVSPVDLDDDDIAAERNEDEAHDALLMHERSSAEEVPTLFSENDPESEADRFLDVGEQVGDEDGEAVEAELVRDNGAFEAAAAAAVDAPSVRAHPRVSAFESRVDQPSLVAEETRSGPRMLPLAVTLILGLLVGFAAGYGVGSRDQAIEDASGATQPPTGKPWSEQAVAPPAGAAAPPAAEPSRTAPDPQPDTRPASPAAPERAPRASVGRMVVRTTPSGASVTLNGRWRGRSPLTLEKLPFAAYTVRVARPGFAVRREDVTLSAAAPELSLSLRLQRQAPPRRGEPEPRAGQENPSYAGTLYVDSRPRGARVFVDGRAVGTTPVSIPELPIGSHVVRLELTDHRVWTTTTRISSGQMARVTGSLERIR